MKTRYSKLKATGRLLESQSGGDESNPQHLQDLIDNAVSSGHSKEDIEVGYEDDAVVQGWLKDANEASKTYADRRKPLYGTWEEQLDMMYHGTWEKHVAKVKQDIPKENR